MFRKIALILAIAVCVLLVVGIVAGASVERVETAQTDGLVCDDAGTTCYNPSVCQIGQSGSIICWAK